MIKFKDSNKKVSFLKRIENEILILDGAMGSLLQAKGIETGRCLEELNISEPDLIVEIHSSYFQSGSQLVETNTFGASVFQLSKHGLEDKVKQINIKAVKNAKEASPDFGYVLGSLGPTGLLIEPVGKATFQQVYEAYRDQAVALAEGGADGLIIETITDIQEARAALLAAKENTDLPVIVTLTFGKNLRMEISGTDPASAAVIISNLGADLIGLNCGLGPKGALNILKIMSEYSPVPLVIQPNAGIPRLEDGQTIFPDTPEQMAKYVPEFISLGARIIGACCGSTPDHIAKISFAKGDLKPILINNKGQIAVSSPRETLVLKKNGPLYIIGEKINPSGNERITEAIKNKEYGLLQEEAKAQSEKGADIIDVNVGVAGLDEKEILSEAIKEISKTVEKPLVLDSVDPDALGEALRLYPGRAIINSVNGKKDSLNNILPLAKKYGALVIGLTLDKHGIPGSAFERLEIAKKIIEEAQKLGLSKKNIIIDPLVLTAATNKESVNVSLESVKLISEKLNVLTVLGISNVSHGLPERESFNKAFLAMAINYGLNIAIVDPTEADLVEISRASSFINNRNFPFDELVERLSGVKEIVHEEEIESVEPLAQLKDAVISGQVEKALSLVEVVLKKGSRPLEIINDALTPALDKVGERFGKGEIFLPQVLLSAETTKKVFKRIKSELNQEDIKTKGKFVFATVEGDIHNIGKDICISLLESNAFEVIDLGVDVPADYIVEQALENSVDAVGLSALMTTTLPAMEETIKKIKDKSSKLKIFIGGAVISKDYAEKVGADAYAEDAIELIEIAVKKLTGDK